MMPQKKNPDLLELIRGKSGRVIGDLVAMLTMLKGLPLAYNSDLQEDKERVFDALDTIKPALDLLAKLWPRLRFDAAAMRAAAGGFALATDLAEYLVRARRRRFARRTRSSARWCARRPPPDGRSKT